MPEKYHADAALRILNATYNTCVYLLDLGSCFAYLPPRPPCPRDDPIEDEPPLFMLPALLPRVLLPLKLLPLDALTPKFPPLELLPLKFPPLELLFASGVRTPAKPDPPTLGVVVVGFPYDLPPLSVSVLAPIPLGVLSMFVEGLPVVLSVLLLLEVP